VDSHPSRSFRSAAGTAVEKEKKHATLHEPGFIGSGSGSLQIRLDLPPNASGQAACMEEREPRVA